MNKIVKFWGKICLIWMACSIAVFANGQAAVIESYSGEDSISMYVSGIDGDIANISAQIGTNMAEKVSSQVISDMEVPMQTLVMLDNSLSISKSDREKIAALMHDIIADRMTGEQIAIATFSENISYIIDYTDDYGTLKTAVEGIEYQDQETYLTDVLYELLSAERLSDKNDIYRRIVIISDGVDNKSLGYTKEELLSLLGEYSLPIYSVGCSTGKNNEQLENMFALSRMTSAECFLLTDIENTLDISSALKRDRSVVKFLVKPTPADMDGTKKAVKLTFNVGTEQVDLSTEIKMPQKQMEIVETTETESVEEETSEELVVEEEQEETNLPVVLIIVFCVLAVLAIIGIIILLILLKKRRKVEFEGIDDSILRDLELNVPDQTSKTEIITSFTRGDDDDKTCMIWNENSSYHVILTDVESPMKSFQMPLNSSIIIGRKQGVCGIVIDYDKSVSGRHCQISVRNGKFYISDLQSSNGTYVNDNKILSEVEIFSGTIIKLGRLKLRFEVR